MIMIILTRIVIYICRPPSTLSTLMRLSSSHSQGRSDLYLWASFPFLSLLGQQRKDTVEGGGVPHSLLFPFGSLPNRVVMVLELGRER